jgi:MFS family permease
MVAPEVTAETIPSETISVWRPPYRILTIAMMLTITAAAFEALAVATIMPSINNDLNNLELYGWAFSAFMLTKLIGITMAGTEVDRQGPALPFIIGVVFFVAGLLMAGLAPTMLILIIGRAVQGLGAGVFGSVVYAIIARGYPETIRPRMLALTSTAWIVPGLIGPAIAGVIGDYIGWRWVFLGLIPMPIIALVLALPALQRLGNAAEKPHEWNSALLAVRLVLGVALLTSGLGATWPWSILLVGAGLLIGFPALHKLLPEGTLRAAPGLPAAVACMGLLTMAFFGYEAFVPLALNKIHHQSSSMTGLVLTAATVTWTIGSWLLDRYATRFSRRAFALTGVILIVAGFGIGLLMLMPQLPAWIGIVAWGVAGLGIGLTYTTLSLVTLDLAPSGKEGASAAALQTTDGLGGALGTGIGGVIIAANAAQPAAVGLQIHFLLMTAVIALGIFVASRLPGRQV